MLNARPPKLPKRVAYLGTFEAVAREWLKRLTRNAMAGHTFRAAVTDAKGRVLLGVWQFLSSGDEIYVSIVDIARQFKTSLHSSERYRMGFTTQEESDRFRAEGLDKAVHKWIPLPLTSAARVPFRY